MSLPPLHLDVRNNAELLPQRRVFDQDLYERVLDPELCDRQLFLLFNNTVLALPFLDAGIRFPRGFLEGNTVDLGNYHQCLALQQDIANTTIEGKYCSIYLPFNQEIQLPEFPPWPEIQPIFEELKYKIKGYEYLKTQVQKLTLTDNPELSRDGFLMTRKETRQYPYYRQHSSALGDKSFTAVDRLQPYPNPSTTVPAVFIIFRPPSTASASIIGNDKALTTQ
ncbi:hypothetical protein EVAR_14681_1 [Eumeta japonica]|uniref:Nose resistant-to-fluoxetine protein N-terminal domain-containing protein n=1 Tax=Eumeta variegata TaxID=151549 RepID=A0A4C1U296_EUMVA|nr:hypothetical protein EVAR_14681_1 [Eumeta japonica]